MSCAYLWDPVQGMGCYVCDTADMAFGPVRYDRLDDEKVRAELARRGVERGDPRLAHSSILEDVMRDEEMIWKEEA